jgi:hypothetical protein
MAEWNMEKSTGQPLIDTIMKDGSFHHFPARVLDVLLTKDHVLKFKRSSGWVTVGADPVRAKHREDVCPIYFGPERRGYRNHSRSGAH